MCTINGMTFVRHSVYIYIYIYVYIYMGLETDSIFQRINLQSIKKCIHASMVTCSRVLDNSTFRLYLQYRRCATCDGSLRPSRL